MRPVLYERLIQYILENQGRFYRVAYSYTRHQEDDLEKELDSLDMDVQEIIKLRFFEELSLKEISGITGLKLNTVKSKLYRGLKQLKENIQEVNQWEN